MGKCLLIAFEKIWVCVSHKGGLTVLTRVVVTIHQTLNKINKTQRLLSLLSHFVGVTDGIVVGDRLQKDVQHWLSPPNPSTNQNFVRRARHTETAAWFFESSALTEWKAKGSLLWIHGKRTSFKRPMSSFSNLPLLTLQRGRGKARFCMS